MKEVVKILTWVTQSGAYSITRIKHQEERKHKYGGEYAYGNSIVTNPSFAINK